LAPADSTPYESPQTINLRDQAQRELRGIVEAVTQQLTRHMANLQGEKTPPMLYRELDEIVSRVGSSRTSLLVDTFVVAAHAASTLDQFETAGIHNVGIVPEHLRAVRKLFDARTRNRIKYNGPGSRIKKGEMPSKSTLNRIRRAQKKIEKLGRVDVLTAGDDDVCPVCEEISENGPYTINKARKLIPAHPNCRCAFIPADDARFSEID
jgi:hypothetical protein